jgi:hypothetical protein
MRDLSGVLHATAVGVDIQFIIRQQWRRRPLPTFFLSQTIPVLLKRVTNIEIVFTFLYWKIWIFFFKSELGLSYVILNKQRRFTQGIFRDDFLINQFEGGCIVTTVVYLEVYIVPRMWFCKNCFVEKLTVESWVSWMLNHCVRRLLALCLIVETTDWHNLQMSGLCYVRSGKYPSVTIRWQ